MLADTQTSSKNQIGSLRESIPLFLSQLKKDQEGDYRPCCEGYTQDGKEISLGFSCFVLKIAYTLGLWDELGGAQQKAWIEHIRSFQLTEEQALGPVTRHAFFDPALMQALCDKEGMSLSQFDALDQGHDHNPCQKAVIAETKQALATLYQVGAHARYSYTGFPQSSKDVLCFLQHLDWTRPWAAGGQAAALVVFIQTQRFEGFDDDAAEGLKCVCADFFSQRSDPNTGSYFMGAVPSRAQCVNGAMKVLTALDWMERPIHYPKALIDVCLQELPSADGCHLVDVVYVLYQCLGQITYRQGDIQEYCLIILDMIKDHWNKDGGFSYYKGKSQTNYYGATISKGWAESDIHGTCLLTWALAMMSRILNAEPWTWNVLRP